MTPEATVVEGVVSRISSGGNAILVTSEGQELNIGPLGEAVVDERVRAAKLTDPWGLCLEPAFVTESYLEEMESRTGSSISIDKLRSLVGGSVSADDVGRLVRTQIDPAQRVSRYEGDKPIRVHRGGFDGGPNPNSEIPVEIVAVRNGAAIGVPALERLETVEVEPGDVVELVVQSAAQERREVKGFTGDTGLPVHSTELVATPGTVPKVGVLNVFNTHLDASPIALPDDMWPDIGETVDVTIHRVTESGRGYGFTEGLPVILHDALESLSSIDGFKTKVIDRSDSVLTVAVDELGPSDRPDIDDVITASVISREEGGTLCRTEDVPIWIPGSIPEVIEESTCRIVDIASSHLVASVAECPEVRSLNRSDRIFVRVDYRVGDDGVGTYEGVPVVIRGGRDLVGKEVGFGFKKAEAGCILVGIDALNEIPEVGEEIVLSEEVLNLRDDRLCFVESLPVMLPEGSDWPPGNVRIGVDEVTPAGIRVSVASLSPEKRPDLGDIVEINVSDLVQDGDTVLIDGIPVEIPGQISQLSGIVQLGVSGVQPNSLRCSISGLPSSSVPGVGEVVTIEVDCDFERGSSGRVSGVPTLLPRTDFNGGGTREVLIVDHDEDFLIAVEVGTGEYDLELEGEGLIEYYRALKGARDAWQENDFDLAIDNCRDAAKLVRGHSHAAQVLRLDTLRHETILMGEQVRRQQGVRAAQLSVEHAIDTLSLPDVPEASWMLEELKAYRFALTGLSRDGSMTVGYLIAATRAMNTAKDIAQSPWREVIPHPIFASFLASIRKPKTPTAEKAEQLVSESPEYWPFLTLGEVSETISR